MKKFKFNLAALLRMKQALEHEIKQELMQIQILCEEKRNEIVQTERKLEEWSTYYNTVLKSGNNSAELAIIDKHIYNLYRFKDQLAITLEVFNKKREDILVQYQEIKRDVEMIEHMKDKYYQEYKTGVLKEEEKISDEMATLRFSRERVCDE